MTAIRLDLLIEQGADFELDLDIPPGIYLAGAQFAMQFKVFYEDRTAMLTLTTANGGLVVNAITRKLKVVIDAIATAALYPGDYLQDIKVQEASGFISRLYQGSATVTPEVTTYDFDDSPSALLYHGGGYLIQNGGGRILLRI